MAKTRSAPRASARGAGRHQADPKAEYKREVGDRLRQSRIEAGGMSQRELADLLGVTERTIQAYEQGETIPYRYTSRLQEVLDVSAHWLLHGEEERGAVELEEVLKEIRALARKVDKLAAKFD